MMTSHSVCSILRSQATAALERGGRWHNCDGNLRIGHFGVQVANLSLVEADGSVRSTARFSCYLSGTNESISPTRCTREDYSQAHSVFNPLQGFGKRSHLVAFVIGLRFGITFALRWQICML